MEGSNIYMYFESYNVLYKCLVWYFSKVINNLVHYVSLLGVKNWEGMEDPEGFLKDDISLF